MHAAGDEKRRASCLVSLATMAWLSGMQERHFCGAERAKSVSAAAVTGGGNGQPRGGGVIFSILESISGLPREEVAVAALLGHVHELVASVVRVRVRVR